MGQRIEKFALEYWDGKTWIMAAQGTSIGFKRLLKFSTVKAVKLRLKILSSRLNPCLAEFGLFFMKV